MGVEGCLVDPFLVEDEGGWIFDGLVEEVLVAAVFLEGGSDELEEFAAHEGYGVGLGFDGGGYEEHWIVIGYLLMVIGRDASGAGAPDLFGFHVALSGLLGLL